MDSAAVLRSFHCSVGTVSHVQSTIEKTGMIPMCNVTLKKSSFSQGLSGRGRLFSPVIRKGAFVSCVKASETPIAATLEVASLDSNSQGSTEKKNGLTAMFPSGFEELVLEVCDETDVAELKLKIGDFEMNLKRNIGATTSPAPVVSHSVPAVGSFLTGRIVKEKKQPPLCKVGDIIKEGQIIGYLDQFGSELPVRSDVSGEVLKMLYSDGEAVGYGDPLMAVLPSFHGIR
ncbi:hypothetical protein AQUCO_00400463v1 [Aquilegia coerulea]|uniref:Lipoyl-binding domain-containing protein n=1 Tax=Aquilegia coerulea TaxID=218851 RepID=A0A2G5EV27_AQUCA|nr:hypothetical protein AQUCO_00400463v1 [Aquilegia coerulea]